MLRNGIRFDGGLIVGVGATVGTDVGPAVGFRLMGDDDGQDVGVVVGDGEGDDVGATVGIDLGLDVGPAVGFRLVGDDVRPAVGFRLVGDDVRLAVGFRLVDDDVRLAVGFRLMGDDVGDNVRMIVGAGDGRLVRPVGAWDGGDRFEGKYVGREDGRLDPATVATST